MFLFIVRKIGNATIESGILLTDNLEIHTLEVPKTRKLNECTKKADLLNWMKFFDAKTEDELKMLAEKSPVMKKASLRLIELSADEKARQLYEARLKEQRDNYAREKGAIFTIAKNLLRVGDTIDKVVMVTGLTHEEVEYVQNADF